MNDLNTELSQKPTPSNFRFKTDSKTLGLFIATLVLAIAGIASVITLSSRKSTAPTQSQAATPACTASLFVPARATPTPAPCVTCNYQIDLFWGPVLRSFANGDRYSGPIRRLITSSHDRNSTPANPSCDLAAVPPIPNAVIPGLPAGCQDPVNRGLLVGNISNRYTSPPNGFVTATVTNKSTSCTYSVGLASYKADNSLYSDWAKYLATQNLYDSTTLSLAPGQSRTLFVKVGMNHDSPLCHTSPTGTPRPSYTPALRPTTTPTPRTSPTQAPISCKVIFDQQDSLYCSPTAGSVTMTGTIIAAPAGSRLQTAWHIVHPTDKQTAPVYSTIPAAVGTKFRVTATWPGIRSTDTVVEIHAGANILNSAGNPIPNCWASLDYYWYPWAARICAASSLRIVPSLPAPGTLSGQGVQNLPKAAIPSLAPIPLSTVASQVPPASGLLTPAP